MTAEQFTRVANTDFRHLEVKRSKRRRHSLEIAEKVRHRVGQNSR